MSGLLGIIDLKGQTALDAYLQEAITKMSHRSWYVSDVWSDENAQIGLGRIGIGIFNRDKQPIIRADGRYILFMSGEFYRTETIRNRLDKAGVSPRDSSDPELAMSAFQAYGHEFAKELEGAFFICIFDREQQRLVITNDRLGLYPHYFFIETGRFVIAPEVKGVLCAQFVDKNLNLTALAEYMRFQQLLGVKTFHEGILLFPYASVGIFDLRSDEWTVYRYWDWDQIPHRPEMAFEEAVEECSYLLRQAVTTLSSDSLRPGVLLSGGLDSRTIVGLMTPREPAPVTATFGAANCRDVYYAEKIARTVRSRHLWFDLPDGKWVLDNTDLHLRLTEGFHDWVHLHGITMFPELRKVIDYNLTGWDGGSVMGHPFMVRDAITDPLDDMTLVAELFKGLTTIYTWPGMTEVEHTMLYTSEYVGLLYGRAFESLVQEFKHYQNFVRTWRPEFFFINNHDRRLTGNMMAITRAFVEVRFPFWDYQLIDAMYSYSPHVRQDLKLYYRVLSREIPRLSLIPRDSDEYLPTSVQYLRQLHSFYVRVRRRLGIFPQRPTLYADYENYLRHELRGWAESILFDGRLAQRGIFNMDFVRSLFERHMSGREEWTIGKIAPIMTFEMMMREYFD